MQQTADDLAVGGLGKKLHGGLRGDRPDVRDLEKLLGGRLHQPLHAAEFLRQVQRRDTPHVPDSQRVDQAAQFHVPAVVDVTDDLARQPQFLLLPDSQCLVQDPQLGIGRRGPVKKLPRRIGSLPVARRQLAQVFRSRLPQRIQGREFPRQFLCPSRSDFRDTLEHVPEDGLPEALRVEGALQEFVPSTPGPSCPARPRPNPRQFAFRSASSEEKLAESQIVDLRAVNIA